jgi:hypothetical protein
LAIRPRRLFRLSISFPPRPMMMPGRAVWMMTRIFGPMRSMAI